MENKENNIQLDQDKRTNYIDDDLIIHMDRYWINIRSLLEKED